MSTVTDPIADLLARVRNAASAQKTEMFVPYSKIKAEIVRILKDEGYITDYAVDTEAAHPRIKITNKIANRTSAITGLKRVSRPGLRRYVGAEEIPRVLGGMGMAILSTPRGVLVGPRSEKTKRGRRIAGLRLVSALIVMSRIGNKAVEIPDKVKVNIGSRWRRRGRRSEGQTELELAARDQGAASQDNRVSIVREAETRSVKALHGLSRSLVQQHGAGRERRIHQAARDRRRRFQGRGAGSESESEPRIFASDSVSDSEGNQNHRDR